MIGTKAMIRKEDKMKKTIKNLVFDVGGVLLEYRWRDMFREQGLEEEEIDKLEKTKLNVKEYSKRDEEYHWFALAAFLCVLLEVLLRNSVLKKIP